MCSRAWDTKWDTKRATRRTGRFGSPLLPHPTKGSRSGELLAPLLPSALRKPLCCHECPTPPFDCPRRPPPTPQGRRRPPRKLCCPCGRSAPSMVCRSNRMRSHVVGVSRTPLVDRLVSNSPRLKERLASETMVAVQRQGRRNAGEPASADLRQLTGFVSVAQGEGVAAKSDDGVKDHRPCGTVYRGAPTLASSGPSR